jgi:hypothetical protein
MFSFDIGAFQRREAASIARAIDAAKQQKVDEANRNAEINRRAMEQVRLINEQAIRELKRFEQLAPKTVVLRPGSVAPPPPPLVFK